MNPNFVASALPGRQGGWRPGDLCWRLAVLVVASLLLVACAASSPQEPVPEGLPDYAYRSALALKGYQVAVAQQELLGQLPCYCGCGQDPEYKNLLDCFLDPSDGQFRSHAANCQICLEEAEDAAQWKAEGLSVKEIRARIDAKYEGRGDPTDTPPVA